MTDNPWQTVKKNTIYTNKFGYTLREDDVITPAGKPGKFMILESKGYAATVAITKDNEIVMAKMWRYALGEESIELAAGGIESKESPLEAAKRELQEETGVTGGNWRLLGDFYSNVGFSNVKGWIYLATDVNVNENIHPDETERITVVRFPFEKAVEMAANGEFKDGKTIMGILLAKEVLATHH